MVRRLRSLKEIINMGDVKMNRLDYLKLVNRNDMLLFVAWIFMTLYVALLTYDSPLFVRLPAIVIGLFFIAFGWFMARIRLKNEFPDFHKRGD